MSIPSPEEENIYLSGEYIRRNPTWGEKDARWKATRVISHLQSLDVRPESICDIGCGTGAVLNRLSTAFPQASVTGYEISPQAIAVGSARYPSVKLIQGSAFDYSETFDVALALDVMEHVDDYIGFVRGMTGKARLSVLHIPLDMAVQTVARMGPLLRSRQTVGHLHYFSRETALATLEHAGFQVVAEEFTTASPDFRGSALRKRSVDAVRLAAHRVRPHIAARLLGGFSLLVSARPRGQHCQLSRLSEGGGRGSAVPTGGPVAGSAGTD